ncbi:hypothetical protein LSH36_159g02008 [Paralvinella palmiformis]|uniref:Uncharacterized protein n=1 Tax=Paralvinella palmiformis TaxID=53620 RepID=A0AAD9JTV9_9ANNE|nr:hypothetical protein LSH36_159g02008 [Paralvinella palmiformis]
MKGKWEKVLYKNQGVPDNYVDESFLDEMKKNLYTRTYDFWMVVIESGVVTQQISRVSQSLSLNAAIFASVCLASRLSTTWHAFTTITCAVEIFALWPVLRRNLRTVLPNSQLVLTVFLGILALVVIATVTTVGAILFLLFHLFVTFICPARLIKIQPYKNNIYGPWDEAVIKD